MNTTRPSRPKASGCRRAKSAMFVIGASGTRVTGAPDPASNPEAFDRGVARLQDLGFTMASEGGGVAYFHHGSASFLLQDFCAEGLAENFMMHLLVPDVQAWWDHVRDSGLATKYGVQVTPLEDQPWRMRDFCLADPSGVLWRIGQNIG